MVRVKDSRPRYSKEHYSAPVVTISVDEKQSANAGRDRGYQRDEFSNKYSHQQRNQIHSSSTANDDDFNEYDYEIIDGRGDAPRINFGGGHHRPSKYEGSFKNIDSEYEEEDDEPPMPLPEIRPQKAGKNLTRSTGSFRTALNNHPLVKQQQQRQQQLSNSGNGVYEKVRPAMGTKQIIHHPRPQHGERKHVSDVKDFEREQQHQGHHGRKLPTANYRQRRQSVDEEAPRHSSGQQPYGRGYDLEDEAPVFSPPQHGNLNRQNSNQVRLEDVQPYLEEIDEMEEETPKQKPPAKTIQIVATNATANSKYAAAQSENKRQWEPLQKSQHQKEIEEIQQKILHRRSMAAREREEERLLDLEMARPTHSSKVRSVVDLLNKEPGKNLKSVMSEGESQYKSSPKVPPPPAKTGPIPPPPPPPQNLLIKAGNVTPKLQKPTPVSLATDDVYKQAQNDTLPPPPPQLQYRKPEPSLPISTRTNSPLGTKPQPSRSGAEILSDEADLLLQFFKSNWQIVDYLNLKIPNEVVDRMNRLPRKIVILREASELARMRKMRRPGKRLRGRKVTKAGLQKRVIERVASMKSEEISRIVSGSSSLSRHETEREGEIYDSRIETKIYAKSERRSGDVPFPARRQSSVEHEDPVYEESKWNLIKKGGRFMKKSAAALMTKRQSPSPTPLQGPKPQPPVRELPPSENGNGGIRTESRIAAEIQNLKEREDELRRNRAEMGLPNVNDLIGGWRQQDPRMCPLRETRSYNHLKINVNEPEGQRNWPPLQSAGHYGMAKSESFHQLHNQPPQHHPYPQHSQHPQHPQQQHSVSGPKYFRRGTYDINASVNSSSGWAASEKNYRRRSVAATLVNRRIHSRTPLPIYQQHPPIPPHPVHHHPSIIQPSIHTFNRNTPLMKSGSRPLSRLLFVSKRRSKPKSGRMGL